MASSVLDTLPSHPPTPQAALPAGFLTRLARIAEKPHTHILGIDHCALCPSISSASTLATIGPDGSLYLAPLLLVHYVADHGYQPPAPFVDAIMHGSLHDASEPLGNLQTGGTVFLIRPPARPAVTVQDIVFRANQRFDERFEKVHLDIRFELRAAPHPRPGEAEDLIEALVEAVAVRAPERPAARGADVVHLAGDELGHPYLRRAIVSMRIVRMRTGPSGWSTGVVRPAE